MKLLVRKLMLLPFYLATLLVDCMGIVVRYLLRPRHGVREPGYPRGISIIVPERANKEILRCCLESLRSACASLEEPVEVIVVVSDAVESAYEDLIRDFPGHWIFRSRPLWFIEAASVGIEAAKYGWAYLLNSDMIVDAAALREAAKLRSSSVFAIASQIYFQDPARRREETGLTEIRSAGKLLEIRDAETQDECLVRQHPYAGGGSSLFRRDLLAAFIDKTRTYAPAYWEDVEWGILAWRNGFEVLFCPQSKAWHAYRSTISKFFSLQEIDRIFQRNCLLFQLRTALPADSLRTVFGSIARLDRNSFLEILSPRRILETLRSRSGVYFAPPLDLETLPESEVHYEGRARRPELPLVLMVSPYCVYPPAHGGARRIHELIDRFVRDFDVILLSDEAEIYSDASLKYFEKCHRVCLVGGRKAPKSDNRIQRILAHSRPGLANRLRMLVQVHNPDIIQIEYIELAKLVEERDARPWVLTLHDVLLEQPGIDSREEDAFEQRYIDRFDQVIVCGPEDRVLLRNRNVHIVHNGAQVTAPYTPSPPNGPILFMGPFRYPPNLSGILEFLQEVFPTVQARVPSARLWILGGRDARNIAARNAGFNRPGVSVFDYIEDVFPYLRDCSISINPDRAVRGSSLKVIESLAAGRVCISTRDGARGILQSNLPSLLIAEEKDFADCIVRLLTDAGYRHGLEVPTEALHRHSWQHTSEEQVRIYRSLLKTGCLIRTCASGRAGIQEQ